MANVVSVYRSVGVRSADGKIVQTYPQIREMKENMTEVYRKTRLAFGRIFQG